MAGGKIRGISIELSADVSGIIKGLKSVDGSIKRTQTQLRDVNKLLKLDPTNMTLLKQRTQLLQQQIGNTKTKLDELKKAEAKMKSEGVDENSEQFQALQREIIATEQELKKLKGTAGSGSATMLKISESAKGLSEGLGKAGKALMPVTAGVTALGVASVKAFQEVDDGADIVITKTGAVGESAEELEKVYEEVATSVKGSFEDAGKAVGEVNTRFKLTGDDLSGLSQEFMKFSNITGQDVESAVIGVDMAMKTFGIDAKDADGVLGILAKTGQDTGISVETLEQMLQNSGAQLKEMGLGLGESVELMGNFESAGLDSRKMLARLGKGAATFQKKGMNMSEGLTDLIDRLNDSSTEADATAEAYEIFGSRGALAFIDAAKEGKLQFKNLSTDLSGFKNVVGETYEGILDETDQLELTWKTTKVALADAGKTLMNALAPALQKVAQFVKDLTDKWKGLDDGTKQTVLKIAGIAAAIAPALMALSKLASGFSAVTKVMSTLKFTSFITNPVTLAIGAVAGLAAVVADLVIKQNEAIKKCHPFRKELDALKTSSDELQSSINSTRQSYEDESAQAEINAEKAKELKDRLFELVEQEDKTAGQKAEIKQLVADLNEIIPDLNLAYDEQADKLNKTNAELENNIELTRLQAEVDAAASAYSDSMENRIKATQQANKAQQIYDDTLAESSDEARRYAEEIENGANALLTELKYTPGAVEQGKHLVESKEALKTASENLTEAQKDEKAYADILNDAQEDLAKTTKSVQKETSKVRFDGFIKKVKQGFGDKYSAELDAAIRRTHEAGVKIPTELKNQMKAGSVSVSAAVKQLNGLVSFKEAEKTARSNKIGKNMAVTMKQQTADVKAANSTMNGAVNTTKAEATAKHNKVAKEMAGGINSNLHRVSVANQNLNSKVDLSDATATAYSSGVKIPTDMSSGMDANASKVKTSAEGISSAALDNIDTSGAYTKGYDLVDQVRKGMDAAKAGLVKTVNIIIEAMNGVKNGSNSVSSVVGTPITPTPATTAGNVYNFNQVNNSPTSLNTSDIYRQSKNLLNTKG